MEFKELTKKTIKELQQLLNESREKLRDLRFKDGNKQLKNVKEIKKVRIIIAQILTLINKNKAIEEKQLIVKIK
ncbi:MAG: 50S ribosomal protein L29 [Patescibacteria group bacterium]|nr:50S ribosomal protein L29 [Patescibacteria group bacterium]MBU1871050.1 50S ribosomal protein L29 [Patescibacteria group bacterium]